MCDSETHAIALRACLKKCLLTSPLSRLQSGSQAPLGMQQCSLLLWTTFQRKQWVLLRLLMRIMRAVLMNSMTLKTSWFVPLHHDF